MAAKFDKRLKNILVKRGALSTKAAEDALALAEKDTRTLTEIVIDQKLLSERDVIAAVALEMKMPPIDVTRVEVDETVLESLPQDLAKYYGVLPIARIGDSLTLAVSNPFDILKLDDIRIVTGCNLRPVVSTDVAIQKAIAKVYDRSSQKLEEMYANLVDPEVEIAKEPTDDIDDGMSLDEKSPVVKLVNLLIMQAVKDRVSDIHIEPMERKMRIRFRKDGVLQEWNPPPHKKYQNAISSRIKIMASLDIAEKRIPQDGKFQTKIEGRQVDFRVSILPTLHGEKTVLRILDSSNLALSLDSLGFETQALEGFKKSLSQPYGMVLVTGPTGSGKTTTLYSALREVMTTEDNVVTVEDPVEYQLEGVVQVPVNPKKGLTFAAALRSILRQDPDTVMIGEMRDLETVEIAVKAALTGHLVLSTLHTNDAASTITRLIDMGVDPFMVTSTILLASAQRLLRKICPECREPWNPPPERLIEVGYTEEDLATGQFEFYKARGCPRCANGYKGRFAILEALVMSDRMKRLVLEGKSDVELKKAAMEEGMITLRRCALLNAMRGRTTVEEVLRMTADDASKKPPGGRHADALDEDVR
ncbi:MAG TPA: ATPase, T2SS/T4P/T4SS family [Planctomycetota bacterium]|nr:ATPase, T2SS/T4P/T4SS family [Planctomycetota bacterium]